MVLRCSIVLTEVIISLSELVKLSRCSSHLVRVTKSSLEDSDECLHIFEVDFIGKDIRLNLILHIAFEESIYVVKLVLIIGVTRGFSCKLPIHFGDKIQEFLVVSRELRRMWQFDWLAG
jgi:hypothetical protein